MASRKIRKGFAKFANDSEWQKAFRDEVKSIQLTLSIVDEKLRRNSLKGRLNNN